MSWSHVVSIMTRVRSAHLFALGGVSVTPGTLLTIVVVVAITLLISRLVQRAMTNRQQAQSGNLVGAEEGAHRDRLPAG